MEIPVNTIELEAVSSVESIINAYDGTSDSWKVPLIGSFWEAVHHAHEIRRRGQGNRVAVIDSGCDLSVPRLKRQVGKYYNLAKRPATGRHNDHGTAVALLISEVAPDCILDIYNVVAEDGTIQEPSVVEAIARAARSDAAIINLSLGTPREWIPRGDIASFENWDDYLAHKRDTFSETEPCPLCAAALSATDNGKMVFASVGNELRHAYCPARADRVVAVGFQSQRTLKQELGFETRQQVPVLDQSIGADLMLLEVPGALGSSFASPLYAGVAALGLTPEELFKYVASYAARVFPLMKHAMVDTDLGGVSQAPPQLLGEIDRGYWKSVSLLPHAHCKVQARRLPRVELIDPAACPFCGILADLQLVNLGYWLYSQGHPLEALDVLKAARTLCPWSYEAVAFEGSALSMIGRHDEAIKNYEVAVQMRPGYPPYQSALEALRTIARLDGSELPSGAENTLLDFVRARRRQARTDESDSLCPCGCPGRGSFGVPDEHPGEMAPARSRHHRAGFGVSVLPQCAGVRQVFPSPAGSPNTLQSHDAGSPAAHFLGRFRGFRRGPFGGDILPLGTIWRCKLTDLDPDPCVVAMKRYTDKRRWLNLWTMLLWIFGVTVVLFSCVAILLFVRQTWLPGAITVLGTIVNGAGIAWVVTQRKGAEQEERDAFALFSTECGGRRQSGRSGPSLQSAAADIPTVRELNSRAWKSLLWGGPK